MIKKYVQDGKVAVLHSAACGLPYATNVESPEEAESKMYDFDKVVSTINGDCRTLRIEWVPLGKRFTVVNYDGLEEVITEDSLEYTA